MTVTAEQLETASPAVRRQADLHWQLNHVVLDAVFSARDTAHMQELLTEKLYADKGFQKLPRYRQLALDGYLSGVLDALARTTLGAVSRERPKSVPPKKGKNKQKAASVPPKLYPSNGSVYPIPVWIDPGPQAYLHAPALPSVP